MVAYLSGCEPGFAYWQSEPDGGGTTRWNQHGTHRVICCGSALRRLFRLTCSPGRGGAIRQGTGVRIVASGWIVSSGSARPDTFFSLRKFLAGKQVVPHQASFFGSSLVASIGGYDLISIAADQEFILRAALVCEPVTTGVCCASSTPRASARTGNQARFGDLRRMGDPIAATRSGANITCLPTRPGVLRLQQSILENVFTRMSK